MDYYTAPQIADRLLLPFYTVQRAAADGRLAAQYHFSRAQCDPDNPCHLEPGTKGHHYAITIEDARAWLDHRLEGVSTHTVSWQRGYAAARADVERLFEQGMDDTDRSAIVASWLADNEPVDTTD